MVLSSRVVLQSFDPQARLWVLVVREKDSTIGVEVFGLSKDFSSMIKLEVNKTLQGALFENLDADSQPLLQEYVKAYKGRLGRKKQRVEKKNIADTTATANHAAEAGK